MNASADTVRHWLQQTIDAHTKFGRDTLDSLIAKYLLEHGEAMGPRIDLPAGMEYGETRNCFGNAFGAAFSTDGEGALTYCEGYAYTPGLIACHHAWVVNECGEVIDVTWRDGGTECGFCQGNGTVQKAVEWDEDGDEAGWEEVDCRWCQGTGEQEHEHPSREAAEYLGVRVSRERLIEVVMAKGTYGVLDCPEFNDTLKEAMQG